MEKWLRQIVFLRPGTFVIFDRVVSHDAAIQKTWLLQAMKRPEKRASHLVITNGKGGFSSRHCCRGRRTCNCVTATNCTVTMDNPFPRA